jgi:hypothetical protein
MTSWKNFWKNHNEFEDVMDRFNKWMDKNKPIKLKSMSYIKNDPDGKIAVALRSLGMQVDPVAVELLTSTIDLVRKNSNEGEYTSIEKLMENKKEVEDAMIPKQPQMQAMPGIPPGGRPAN